MAGLAAALNAPDAIDAIAWALSSRGADGAVCHLTGAQRASLAVAIRAAMPAIPRVVAAQEPGEATEHGEPIAAFVIDGIASVTALDQGFATYGPPGLIDSGAQPYATILADAERDELVLARNGDGPGLYYARLDEGWVAASEPGALVQAGVPADPDVGVVRRFIATGACDEAERTFFTRIRRVLPGEAVVLGTAGAAPVRHSTGWERQPVATEPALLEATDGARLGILLTPALSGAAVLGAALAQPQRPRPMPVHTATWSGLEGAAAHSPAVLLAMEQRTVRHAGHTVVGTRADLDRFLSDLGEPVPDLGLVLTWAVARDLPAGIDTLVDASIGGHSGVERVKDRLLARYGVAVRFPLREAESDVDDLAQMVSHTLPKAAVRQAATDSARVATAAEVVIGLGDDVAAALVTPRPWADPALGVPALRRLHSGEAVDADALLRAYLVERWLEVWPSSGEPTPTPAVTEDRHEPEPLPEPTLDEVTVGDSLWLRIAVRTALITLGEPVAPAVSWHVANVLTALWKDPSYQDVAAGPWFVVVSGKAVAVSQNRIDPLLDLVPGHAARLLARMGRRRLPQLGEPWTMQVAIDHSGLGRVLAAVALGVPLGREGDLYPPRPGAVTPADSAVVRAPFEPDGVASALVTAVRLAVPREAADTLAGCAVVSADDRGCRVLGFAAGPAAKAAPRPRTLLALVLADNPAGQAGERTPVVLVARAAVSRNRAPAEQGDLVAADTVTGR
jgi:hypothetical protein